MSVVEVLMKHMFMPAGWVRRGGCSCGWRSRRPTGPLDVSGREQFALHVAAHLTDSTALEALAADLERIAEERKERGNGGGPTLAARRARAQRRAYEDAAARARAALAPAAEGDAGVGS